MTSVNWPDKEFWPVADSVSFGPDNIGTDWKQNRKKLAPDWSASAWPDADIWTRSLIKDLSKMVKQECQSAILSPQVFEPSESEKGMLTSKDNEIRNAAVTERFQVSCESNNRLLFL